MIFNLGHVYSCKWSTESDYVFFNVLDSIDKTKARAVIGRCIGESYKSGPFEKCGDEEFDWEYDSWNNPVNIITDLGPYELFYTTNPELFI